MVCLLFEERKISEVRQMPEGRLVGQVCNPAAGDAEALQGPPRRVVDAGGRSVRRQDGDELARGEIEDLEAGADPPCRRGDLGALELGKQKRRVRDDRAYD